MLIPSHRHTTADLALWSEFEEADHINGHRPAMAARITRGMDVIREFVAAGPCYASVSWGKDSTVLAHLVRLAAPAIPLVWVRVEPIANPDCGAVRDAFLASYPGPYLEVVVPCRHDHAGWHATGTLESGFQEAARRFGDRYVSGVRADESGVRKIAMRTRGLSGPRTCRPLGWWSAADVYAYASVSSLPVHPAYAMLGGGRWTRDQLRVSSLGGRRGDQMGRAEWETEYYGDVLRRLQRCR